MAAEEISQNRPLVTREQAIASGAKRYFTGEQCSRGHIAERSVSSRGCLECLNENAAKWRAADPDRAKAVWTRNNEVTREKRIAKKRQKRQVLCLHCKTPIPFSEQKSDAIRASRPRYCSDRCRLYSKVDKTPGHGPKGDCWVYTGAKHKFGYGMINTSGTKASDITTAHAYAWEIENGPIPDGLFVCHHCDHPPCCRKEHLFLGTHQDNMNDMMEKKRKPMGEDHGMAKLTDQQVVAIFRDTDSDRVVALKYGVSRCAIQKIRRGLTWKHVS
jgi:hypothetical protein